MAKLTGEEDLASESQSVDVSEESLQEVQREVKELAKKAANYRDKGPAAFAKLLEEYLSNMHEGLRAKAAADDRLHGDEGIQDKEVLTQRAALKERHANATASLREVSIKIKSCIERLSKAIEESNKSPASKGHQLQLKMPWVSSFGAQDARKTDDLVSVTE